MRLIRASTLTVSDLDHSTSLYSKWLDYRCVEEGYVETSLAQSWGTPKTASQKYVVLQPQSGAEVFIRLIEQPTLPTYKPLRSYGWAAIEICNQDTLAVNERMERSPFEIIGPPKELDGMPAIFPMQIKGPDQEIIYLTEIRSDLGETDLPQAQSLIDKLFILVMACSDMEATRKWLEDYLLLTTDQAVEIIYSMINDSFDLPPDTKHALATLKHGPDVFLEIDAYPPSTMPRDTHEGMLPPCAAIGSFIHPEFDRLCEINQGHWITPPKARGGVIYKGKRAGTLRDPDGALIEIIEV